jgi:hypothetical protein
MLGRKKMKTTTKDKSSMLDVIWVNNFHDGDVVKRYSVHGYEQYKKTATINAQLDLAISYLEDNCQAHALKILKEMRGA